MIDRVQTEDICLSIGMKRLDILDKMVDGILANTYVRNADNPVEYSLDQAIHIREWAVELAFKLLLWNDKK